MKKILYVLAIAMTLFSCAKEEIKPIEEKEDIIFTASISEGNETKTTIKYNTEGDKGKVLWVKGDIISIKDNAGTIVKYKATTENPSATSKFEKAEGETKSLGVGPYSATYRDLNNQVYNATYPASNCPMEASNTTSATDTNLKFKNNCAVVRITVNPNAVLKAIIVNGYTLHVNAEAAISSSTTFYVAVEATGVNSPLNMTFVDDKFKQCVKKSKSDKTFDLSANKIQPVSLSGTLSYTGWPTLTGKFKVSSSTYVSFAKGNICCDATNLDSPIWGMEVNQYGGITSSEKYDDAYQKHICHFYADPDGGYKKDRTTMTDNTYNWGTIFGDNWCTLTSGEYQYLISKNPWIKCVVNNVRGLLLFPLNYSWPEQLGSIPTLNQEFYSGWNYCTNTYNTTEFNYLENAGFVFLPCSGIRYNSDGSPKYGIKNPNTTGYYFPSNNVKPSSYASFFDLSFTSSSTSAGAGHGSGYAMAVRLVKYTTL